MPSFFCLDSGGGSIGFGVLCEGSSRLRYGRFGNVIQKHVDGSAAEGSGLESGGIRRELQPMSRILHGALQGGYPCDIPDTNGMLVVSKFTLSC